jgi:hypothetical protein
MEDFSKSNVDSVVGGLGFFTHSYTCISLFFACSFQCESGTDSTDLDMWTFDRAEKLFRDARSNATLNAALREPQVVIFLHLLGLDSYGHAKRPYSEE